MTETAELKPIRLSFEVECTPEHAFEVWTARTSGWWPTTHTVSAERGLDVVFEPRSGGRIYERTTTGVEHDWGQVTEWEPPRRLVYQWHLNQDRGDATEVEIRFVAASMDAPRTRVEIEHRGWERLGARGETLRDTNDTGWSGVIPHYVKAASR